MDSEIRIDSAPDVYKPAEDSFLLLKHAVRLKGKILEIGCGTGIISIYCAAADPENTVGGVDINPAAVSLAQKNAKLNRIKNVKFYRSDLFSNVKGRYDWILFNTPYLPTKSDEKVEGQLNRAFDGGISGRELTEKFMMEAPEYLKNGGGILLVASSLSGKDELLAGLESNGLKAKIMDEEALFFERIYVIRAFFNSF